jgi:hypothetical protein
VNENQSAARGWDRLELLNANVFVLNIVGALFAAALTYVLLVFFWPAFVRECREMAIALPRVTQLVISITPTGFLLIFAAVIAGLAAKEVWIASRGARLAVNGLATLAGLSYAVLFLLANAVIVLPILHRSS